jgi:hypothetical protein
VSSLRDYLQTKEVLDHATEVSPKPTTAPSNIPSQQRGLDLLLEGEFPMSVTALFERSGLELPDFTDSLEALKAADLVEVRKTDGGTVVELTTNGQKLRAD